MSWKTLEVTTILDEPYVGVKKNRVMMPDGRVIEDFYTVRIMDAALIAAVTTDGDILLKKEFRYACGEDIIECPAGMINPGEDPLETARRELMEETGYTSDRWTYLGATRESVSKLTNTMHLFLAQDCVQTGKQKLDEYESLELIRVPLDEAVAMVMDNRICANSSAHAILKTERMLRQET